MGTRLLILAGLSAVGRTMLAKKLEAEQGYVRLTKDDPAFAANAVIYERLEFHKKTGIDFWRTDEAKLELEPRLYREMLDKAAGVVEEGRDCIIDAPLLYEAEDSNFLETVRTRVGADDNDIEVRFYWFTASPETIKRNMFAREAERDYAKLRHEHAWENYIEGVDFDFRPAFAHTVIDITDKDADQVYREFTAQLGN